LISFGLTPPAKQLLVIEIGREAATLVLISTGAWLFGKGIQPRCAYFLTIFATWDIFYYVWLKALIDWPSSIMEWDVLFLIPTVWAGPVLAPVLVSIILLGFAIIMLYRDPQARPLKMTMRDGVGLLFAAFVVAVSFCIAGLSAGKPDFRSHFYWPLFACGNLGAIAVLLKCLVQSK
jgi:hypothetical protein